MRMSNPSIKFNTVFTVRIIGKSRKHKDDRYSFTEKMFKDIWESLIKGFMQLSKNTQISMSIEQEENK